MSSISDGIESAMQPHKYTQIYTHARAHTHPHTRTHSNRMTGVVCMAPVQLETETCFESKMIRRPTADGKASLKTFHRSGPKTTRSITSNTHPLGTNENPGDYWLKILATCIWLWLCYDIYAFRPLFYWISQFRFWNMTQLSFPC